MKKVGVLTFAKADNYGALLQCYALQTYIEKNNHTCDLINYYPQYLKSKYEPYISMHLTYSEYKKLDLKNPLLKAVKTWLKNIFFWQRNKYHRAFETFRNSFLNLTDLCNDYKDVKKIVDYYDVAIVGSDQVWSKRITGGSFDPVFFLEGMNIKRKVSYAASAGDDIKDEDINLFKKMVEHLDYVSVREPSLGSQINKILDDKEVIDVLDPVFLISEDEWRNINKDFRKKDRYVFVYNVSSEDTSKYYEYVINFALQNNMKIYEVSKKQKIKNSVFFGSLKPDEFVAMLMNADFVFSTSFHATAFSIIGRRQFLVYKPNNASRLTGLLERLSLEDRLIDSNCKESYLYNLSFIDYNKVNLKLNVFKDVAITYLSKVLD